jgi:hypothetical protein
MHFLKPTKRTLVPPLLLIAFGVIPDTFLILRYTLYTVLAIPLQPLIHRLGWVYHDKPMFLTYPAAVLTAVVWAVLLYLLLCTVRRVLTKP